MTAMTSESPPFESMPLICAFVDVLKHFQVVKKRSQTRPDFRHKLKFVNQSMEPHAEIEHDLSLYLGVYLDKPDYDQLVDRIKDLTEESRICELMLELIRNTESQLDQQSELFDDVVDIMKDTAKRNSPEEHDYQVDATIKCSLLVYDSFVVLRALRKNVTLIARTYHVPFYYDTEEHSFRIRASLLTTYKNICQMMDDFAVLSEAFCYVRSFEMPAQTPAKESQSAAPQVVSSAPQALVGPIATEQAKVNGAL